MLSVVKEEHPEYSEAVYSIIQARKAFLGVLDDTLSQMEGLYQVMEAMDGNLSRKLLEDIRQMDQSLREYRVILVEKMSPR